MVKSAIPGAYVLLSYEVYSEDGTLIETSKRKVKRGEREEEVDIPIVVKIGEKPKAVFFDEYLIGAKENEEREVVVPPEKAYGKRDPKKIQTVPRRLIHRLTREKSIHPGDILRDDKGNYIGIVRYVGSRDVVIDGNHPYAGQNVKVKFKVHRIVLPTDPDEEKIDIILEKYLGEDKDKINTAIEGSKVILKINLAEISLSTYLNKVCLSKMLLSEEIIRETDINTVEFVETFSLIPEGSISTKSIAPSPVVSAEEGKSEESTEAKEKNEGGEKEESNSQRALSEESEK